MTLFSPYLAITQIRKSKKVMSEKKARRITLNPFEDKKRDLELDFALEQQTLVDEVEATDKAIPVLANLIQEMQNTTVRNELRTVITHLQNNRGKFARSAQTPSPSSHAVFKTVMKEFVERNPQVTKVVKTDLPSAGDCLKLASMLPNETEFLVNLHANLKAFDPELYASLIPTEPQTTKPPVSKSIDPPTSKSIDPPSSKSLDPPSSKPIDPPTSKFCDSLVSRSVSPDHTVYNSPQDPPFYQVARRSKNLDARVKHVEIYGPTLLNLMSKILPLKVIFRQPYDPKDFRFDGLVTGVRMTLAPDGPYLDFSFTYDGRKMGFVEFRQCIMNRQHENKYSSKDHIVSLESDIFSLRVWDAANVKWAHFTTVFPQSVVKLSDSKAIERWIALYENK